MCHILIVGQEHFLNGGTFGRIVLKSTLILIWRTHQYPLETLFRIEFIEYNYERIYMKHAQVSYLNSMIQCSLTMRGR